MSVDSKTSTPTFPASADGALCPLLDDGDLMVKFYEGSGAKPDIKKFIKRHRWPGKPPLSFSIGPETMKKMLLSVNGSAQARAVLHEVGAKAENSPELYQVIWNWLTINDPKLVEAVDNHSHTVDDRIFISSDELSGLITAQMADEEWSDDRKTHLAYLVLAFAMLQPQDAPALLKTLAGQFPELAAPIGAA